MGRRLSGWFWLRIIVVTSCIVSFVFACLFFDSRRGAQLVSRSGKKRGPVTGVAFRTPQQDSVIWIWPGESTSAEEKNDGAIGLAQASNPNGTAVIITDGGLSGVTTVGANAYIVSRDGKIYLLNKNDDLHVVKEEDFRLISVFTDRKDYLLVGDSRGRMLKYDTFTWSLTSQWTNDVDDVVGVGIFKSHVLGALFGKTLVVHDVLTSDSLRINFGYILQWIKQSSTGRYVLVGEANHTFLGDLESLSDRGDLITFPPSSAGCWLGESEKFVLFGGDGKVRIGHAGSSELKEIKMPTLTNFSRNPVTAADYSDSSGQMLLGHRSGMVQLSRFND